MSGPFTNTETQLIEQINWLQAAEKLTWDNIRSDFVNHIVASGSYPVVFAPAFPREVTGLDVTLDFSGGVRNWNVGARNVDRFGFDVQVSMAGSWAGGAVPPDGTLVGVYYVAMGR